MNTKEQKYYQNPEVQELTGNERSFLMNCCLCPSLYRKGNNLYCKYQDLQSSLDNKGGSQIMMKSGTSTILETLEQIREDEGFDLICPDREVLITQYCRRDDDTLILKPNK